MAIITILDELKDWLDKNICCNYQFKKEPSMEDANDENYPYALINPKAYIMYVPTGAKTPSVTIQIPNGEIGRFEKTGTATVRLLFATWDTGKHIENTKGVKSFEISQEGWHDVFNFVNGTLRMLKNSTLLGEHIRIKHEDKIQFGQMSEKETMPNYYPYWCAWIEFTIQYGSNSTDSDLQEVI